MGRSSCSAGHELLSSQKECTQLQTHYRLTQCCAVADAGQHRHPHVFQRFSRQQEAMHFADGMNAERRGRAQVLSPITAAVMTCPAHHCYARFAASATQHRRIKVCCAVLLN